MERAQEGIRGEEPETASTDSSFFFFFSFEKFIVDTVTDVPIPIPTPLPASTSPQTALLGPFAAEGMRTRRQ